MSGQLKLERSLITEHLTDDEIIAFDNAVKLYCIGTDEMIAMSDCDISKLPQRLWKQIWKFRDDYSEARAKGAI